MDHGLTGGAMTRSIFDPTGGELEKKRGTFMPGAAGHPVPPTNAPVQQHPLIVRLVERMRSVTVPDGPTCALYAVHPADGALLVSNETVDDVSQKQPALDERLRPVVAVDATRLI